METKLQQEIGKVLSTFPEYWNEDILLKNKLIEDIRSYNEKIIEALLSNDLIKDTYALQLPSGLIFKVEDFISMLRFKNYWENSYTKYTNEIGLTSEGKYLKYNTDVVLDFPHKDSILEAGMSKEEVGKKEIYYHNVIAKEEIDTLLSPKVLDNIKRYNKNGVQNTEEISDTDNLILKGNNLIALHSLKERYAGKIKLIYIDPPYNTGGDSFKYNDRFNHSTWLTFMKNRLEISRTLLSNEGSIWINIDDDEGHYLKVLCDEIFGKNNFMGSIVWRSSDNSNNDAKRFSNDHNYVLVYSKTEGWRPNKLELSKEQSKHYRNPDNDPRGPWFDGNPISSPNPRPNLRYKIEAPNGNVIEPPNFGWRWSEKTLKEKMDNGEIRFNDNYTNIKRRTYLNEQKGIPASTLWSDLDETGHNRQAKYEQKKLFPDKTKEDWFSTPKPEKLIHKILKLGSNEGDIVLDFFSGSGTTPAVAHKMNRKYIGIEQMEYIDDLLISRMKKVIEGDTGGISSDLEWTGGGGFVYAELYSLNNIFVKEIQDCKDSSELETVLKRMGSSAYLNFKVDLNKLTIDSSDFKNLSLEEQKDILIKVLDMNQLYLNYSEIADSQYSISSSLKDFNDSFYQKEGDINEQ